MDHSVPTPNIICFINLSMRKLRPGEISDQPSSPSSEIVGQSLTLRSACLSSICITKPPALVGLLFVNLCIRASIPPGVLAVNRYPVCPLSFSSHLVTKISYLKWPLRGLSTRENKGNAVLKGCIFSLSVVYWAKSWHYSKRPTLKVWFGNWHRAELC